MKMKNKGKAKVHPFTSSSSSFIHKDKDSLSVLNLLPAAILALLSVLSSDDRHVLAYMLTKSLHSDDTTNKSLRKPQCSLPNFDCDCFRCYTAFWLRWDSSPNRDLIHRAIEAFEDHLNSTIIINGDDFKKFKGRKKEKMTRRKADKPSSQVELLDFPAPDLPSNQERVVPAEAAASEADEKGADMEEQTTVEDVGSAAAAAAAPCSHKALARKVLPDVMGIFNSRLWSLWSPNV